MGAAGAKSPGSKACMKFEVLDPPRGSSIGSSHSGSGSSQMGLEILYSSWRVLGVWTPLFLQV